MQTRILLAILILTNPICCQMFGTLGVVRSEEPVAECGRCACECEPCEPSSDGEDVPHTPCECPNCEMCQCICAGAVIKDVVTVDDSHRQPPVDVIVEHPLDGPSDLFQRVHSGDTPMACGEANVGRAARLLHSSLLC